MRLGFVSTYPPIECGIAVYTHYLTEVLREKHTDVYVVSHLGGTGQQVFPCFDYEDGDLAEKAFSMMVRFTPDVVHIQHEFGLFGKHAGVAVIPLILQFRLVAVPVVTTLHTVYPEIPESHRLIFQSIFLNSDRVIVHEPYQQESLKKILTGELARKISIIPHGARKVGAVAKAKERLGLPTDKKVILVIGYFRPSKNFELVIDVFPEILKRFPGAILVVAGKTRGRAHLDYRNMLFDKIAHSPSTENIYPIRGQLPQHVFDTIVSSADVVVLPYNISSQSGILAQCLAFGKPMVTSTTRAMRQILEESRAGLSCLNYDQYIEGIVRILSDDKLALELSRNAKRYVNEVNSWSRVADRHLELYETLVEKPKIKSRIIMVE